MVVLTCVCLFVTLLTVALQASLSMEFSREEYWSWLLCPPPGYLPDSGIGPSSSTSDALVDEFYTISATWEEAPEAQQWNKYRMFSFNLKRGDLGYVSS